MIPNSITREHLLQALKLIENDGARFRSTRFDLLHGGKRYPPKQVVRRAAELAGAPLVEFPGGAETNTFLKSQGFNLVPKQTAARGGEYEGFDDTDSIKPTDRLRVIDLVEEAGHDVSDWANFAGVDPSTNPRYCYEWCFSQPGRADVVCIWFENVSTQNDRLTTTLRLTPDTLVGPRKARIQRLRTCLEAAHARQAPLRVILLTGLQNPRDSEKQSVQFRRLDPIPWHIHGATSGAGVFELRRGPSMSALSDQFDLAIADGGSKRRMVTGEVHIRSAAVRREVLLRAGGRCEFCDALGFVTVTGELFLETHHVVPLSEDGADGAHNVIALCPNHHREAHHGNRFQTLRRQMLEYLELVSQVPNPRTDPAASTDA
jgi:5-methylcytosine-specific restriction protein A